MSEHVRNFLIGLTTLLGLVGFAVLLMFFGELQLFRPQQYEIKVFMTMAGGVREGSPIELNGVRIGQIDRIQLLPEEIHYPIHATASITREKRIPETVRASVERSLLAGTSILQLTTQPPEDGAQLTYIPDDGSGELSVDTRTFFDDLLAELDARTEPLVFALESFTRLSDSFTRVAENVNALIGEQLKTDPDEPTLRAVVTRLNTTLDQAKDMFSRYGKLAESLEKDAATLVQNMLPVTDELSATLEEIRRITTLAREGRGTVAQLLNNPDLYESLLDASMRLERALAEAQLLIQKFQAEGVPVRW